MFDVVLSLDWITQTFFELGDFLCVFLVLLLDQSSLLWFWDILKQINLIQSNLMQISDFFLLVSFVLLNFQFDWVKDWDQYFIFLFDYFLVWTNPMQHIEIKVLIDKSLCMEPVIILSRSDILRKNNFISESLFGIFTCIPVIITFECHYLLYSLSVHSLEIFVV